MAYREVKVILLLSVHSFISKELGDCIMLAIVYYDCPVDHECFT